jgi:hypothetical protein
MSIAKNIARAARRTLGRPAHRHGPRDWAAWDAVARAAAEHGLHGQLLGYVTGARSLTDMARAYVCRYVQAYGPVGDLIDVGAHIGSRTPIVVAITEVA